MLVSQQKLQDSLSLSVEAEKKSFQSFAYLIWPFLSLEKKAR